MMIMIMDKRIDEQKSPLYYFELLYGTVTSTQWQPPRTSLHKFAPTFQRTPEVYRLRLYITP